MAVVAVAMDLFLQFQSQRSLAQQMLVLMEHVCLLLEAIFALPVCLLQVELEVISLEIFKVELFAQHVLLLLYLTDWMLFWRFWLVFLY